MRLLLSVLLVGALASFGASACGRAAAQEARTVDIHYSRFEPAVITVPAGVPVTFTLNNGDPIEHEWIVGDLAVHERHRTGTEPFHDQIPTEVTLPKYSSKTTTVTFERYGEYRFICHLPGHEAYGMAGTVRVVAE